MSHFDYSKNLTADSKKIYLQNQKIEIIIFVIGMLVFSGVYIYFRLQKDNFNSLAQYVVYIPIVLLLVHRMRVYSKGETYMQLVRRDLKNGKADAEEILKSMKEMGNGKK